MTKANDILTTAIKEYREKWDDRILDEAAAELEDMGAAAWSAYEDMVKRDDEELEFFIFPIAYHQGSPRAERVKLLETIASSQYVEVRERLVEVSYRFPDKEQKVIFEALKDDPDDAIRLTARDELDD